MLDLHELMGTYRIINIVYPVQAVMCSGGAGRIGCLGPPGICIQLTEFMIRQMRQYR
jgi:hypothetical protein